MSITFKENRTIEVHSFSDEEHELMTAAVYSATGNKGMSQEYIDRLTELLDLPPGRQLQDRLLLLKCYGAITAFQDPAGNMPENTGEFRELKAVGEDIGRVLGVVAPRNGALCAP